MRPDVPSNHLNGIFVNGIFVNKAPLDFSSTLGLYVAFFAVVGCIIGGTRDHSVKPATIAGVIVVGGLIINYGERVA